MPFSYEPEYTYDEGVSRRTRRKQQETYQVKKLPTLGGMNESFDPNARDGDGDGLVQEGTAFERPATPIAEATNAVSAAVGKPSTTGGTSGRVNAVGNVPDVPGGMPRPSIPMDGRDPLVPTFRPRPAGSPYNKVFGHPQRLKGLTSKQIAEKCVPTTTEELIQLAAESYRGDRESWIARQIAEGVNVNEADYMLALEKSVRRITKLYVNLQQERQISLDMVEKGQMKKREFAKKSGTIGMVDIDFSPETIKFLRGEIERALDESPEFKFAAEHFGLPPIVIPKNDVLSDGTILTRTWGGFFNPGLTMIALDGDRMKAIQGKEPDNIFNLSMNHLANGINQQWTVDPTNGGTIRHEFGHYFAHQLRAKGTSVYFDREDADPAKYDPAANVVALLHTQPIADEPPAAQSMRDAIARGLPYVNSEYGNTSNAEMLAETMAAYLSPHEGHLAKISPQGRFMMDAVFGVGTGGQYPWDQEKLTRRTISRSRGSGGINPSIIPDANGPKSIMDWERPIVSETRKLDADEMQHRVTLGDHSFTWDSYIDPENDIGQRARMRDAESHFDTESFNGAVKHEGDAWFNREVSALLFGYAPSEPDFTDYGKRGLKAGNPEFTAITTGDVSKLNEDDKDEVKMALERAFNVMQAIADEPTSDKPLFRLVTDMEGLKEGDVLPIPTTNFANSISDLPESVLGDQYVSRGQVSTGGAILKIVGPHHSFNGGKESITQGNFRIKSISVDDNGNKVIEMEQVDTFSPRDNAFKSVVTEGQAAMRALGSTTPINVQE